MTPSYPGPRFIPTLAMFTVIWLTSQMAFAAAIGIAESSLVSSETMANDPGNRPPAGTQLAFVSSDQIYLVNSDGTGLVQLTHTGDGLRNLEPAWSRDGQRLAFARGKSGSLSWDIYVMHADGSNEVQLTSGGYNTKPAWGVDDRTIVYSSSVGLSVIDMDTDGGHESRVLLDRPAYDADPAWSPDGQTILFTSDSRAYDFLFDLYAMNADGSNIRPILEGPFDWADGLLEYTQSAWSPDGKNISVVSCAVVWDYCDASIAVANADGSELKVIVQDGRGPTWSPDGQWIAYGSGSGVRFVQVDGGIDGLIVDHGHSPAWRPGAGAQINVSHSGAWQSPATGGQGQFLDVDPDKQFVFLGWMTYTNDESDNPNEQHWFTAQGFYSGSNADLILYETVGGRFGHPGALTTTPVGDATLNFSACDRGKMTYRFDHGGAEGSFPIVRAIPDAGNACESHSESKTQDVVINNGPDGAWFNSDTPGQGFFLDVHAGEAGSKFIFVSWFTYGDDTASGQRWLTAQGHFEGLKANLVIYDTQGGSFDDPQPTESVQVGSMSITFSDCSNAVLSYSLDDEHMAGEMAITRLRPAGEALCEELAVPDY